MATLQTARQSSSFSTRSRLRQAAREHSETQAEPAPSETLVETLSPFGAGVPSAHVSSRASQYSDHLSDLDQRHLLLQTVAIYEGWHLVSVQNRPESGVLVAYLVRNRDEDDPTLAIREGRAMQIIMDAVGDMKVQHPRRKTQYRLLRWLRKLSALFSI